MHQAPTAAELLALRESVGWLTYPVDLAQAAFDSSLFSVSLTVNDEVVGCARVIGDAYYRYVQDVIVAPAWQGKGGGSLMMEHVHRWLLEKSAERYRGLICPPQSVEFYEKFDFQRDGVAMTLRTDSLPSGEK